MKKQIHDMVKNFLTEKSEIRSMDEIVEKLIKINNDIDALKKNYKESDLQSKLNLDHAKGCAATLKWVLNHQ